MEPISDVNMALNEAVAEAKKMVRERHAKAINNAKETLKKIARLKDEDCDYDYSEILRGHADSYSKWIGYAKGLKDLLEQRPVSLV